jgi:predicted secreted Zn-dependent protease
VSERAADVRDEAAEARHRQNEAMEAMPAAAVSPAVLGGLVTRLGGGSRGGGVQRSVARQALRLQAAQGNRYVRSLLHGPAETYAIGRDAAPAAIQRDGSTTTVNMTLAEPTHNTYTLDAADLESAVNQMNARGEWGLGGARDIAYSSGTVNDDGIVSSVTITATLFTTLPNWTQLSSKPQAVQDEWNRMLTALRGHENHHVSIGRTHLEGLRTALAAIHEDDLATTWSEKMTALQDAQNEYDATTTSGQTEGVNLDWSVEHPAEEEEEAGEEESIGIGDMGGEEW